MTMLMSVAQQDAIVWREEVRTAAATTRTTGHNTRVALTRLQEPNGRSRAEDGEVTRGGRVVAATRLIVCDVWGFS